MYQESDCVIELLDNAGKPLLSCHWQGYAQSEDHWSLLRYIDEHGERLRKAYCTLIHEMGETRLPGGRVIDHLAIEDGLSFWWMTLLFEKNVWKTPSIVDALRLLALEEILGQRPPAGVRLAGGNKTIDAALAMLCRQQGIPYQWHQTGLPQGTGQVRQPLWRRWPNWIQAILALLRYLVMHWPLRRNAGTEWFRGGGALFFCSYFDNVNTSAARQGRFHSYYWGGLPDLLQKCGYRSNWLQFFVPQGKAVSAREGSDWLSLFNSAPERQGTHEFIDRQLSTERVYSAVKHWVRLISASRRMDRKEHLFGGNRQKEFLWPVMKADWLRALRGPDAILNLLRLKLIDQAVSRLPYQKIGFYLCENQAWERALIHCWRKHGHGEIVAVPHSTRSFWDLRFFYDPRTFSSTGLHRVPLPDLTVVNGEMAKAAFMADNYPIESLVEGEALRFLGLPGVGKQPAAGAQEDGAARVLILGEFLPSATEHLLRILAKAIPRLKRDILFTLKPHPNCPIRKEDHPELDFRLIDKPLADVLHLFDIAYTGSSTSAALDAYCAGVRVICVMDPDSLNLSPLRGRPGACFVGDAEELARALSECSTAALQNDKAEDIFFLDPSLDRWKGLIAACA